MDGNKPGFQTIDEYIAAQPAEIRALLETMRATIHAAAPDAQEIISYQMPAFYLKGNLVYFGAGKNHIGFYPTPSAIQAFAQELSGYAGAKGSVRFPLDQPLPLALVGKIVTFRVAENLAKAEKKAGKRK
jgi:uncharacterized protein YdhG (YjbR/CyaY superfamily)